MEACLRLHYTDKQLAMSTVYVSLNANETALQAKSSRALILQPALIGFKYS
jgi:hypothetical protein